MAVYHERNDSIFVKEHYMYGSSRLGSIHDWTYVSNLTPHTDTNRFARVLGKKRYELSNHLGNVLTTISDQKKALQDGTTGTVSYWTADVVSYSDYYPGGSLMPGRNGNSSSYRFGAFGHEKDDEVKGNGNHLAFGDYGYDPRIVQRLSRDPKWKEFPFQSPYVAFNNNPIYFTDLDGREPVRSAAGTIDQALAYFKLENATTVNQIDELFRTTSESEPPEGFVRYVYTENNGWIDLRHYFGAIKRGELAMDALELAQCAKKNPSCYSYEDLPSNDMGGNAPVYNYEEGMRSRKEGYTSYKKVQKKGDDLFEAVQADFNEAEATNPESAPNWEQIPANRTRPYGEVPKNFSEKPMNLDNFPPADDSIERQGEQQEQEENQSNGK